jgi:hypothetical protein
MLKILKRKIGFTYMRTTKVNSKVVRAIKVPNHDTRPVRGSDVCPECYANIAILAKKNSGKTSIINKLLKECAGKNGRTSVMAFVSTLEKDAQWQVIKEWCENNNIPFLGYTSMLSGKHNILESFVKNLQKSDSDGDGDGGESKEEPAEPETVSCIRHDPAIPAEAPAEPEPEETKERKPRKSKYLEPEYIIIFDDLSEETRSAFVATLLKKNRHFKMKIIISTQHLNDLAPGALKQLDLVIVLGSHADDKLVELHKKVALSVPFDRFRDMYKNAVGEPYGFLWIDKNKEHYRKNFCEAYE